MGLLVSEIVRERERERLSYIRSAYMLTWTRNNIYSGSNAKMAKL
jgi:hypothetical protein